MPKIKGTRKFGRKQYTLKWDSATFTSHYHPDHVKSIAEKKSNAKLWAKDYKGRGYDTEITTYRGGKEFKVWVCPKDQSL